MRRLQGGMLVLFLFIPVILSMTELFSAEQKKNQDGQRPVSFSQDIQPLFTKMTCDSLGGTLHAKTTPEGIVFMATGLRQQQA